MKTIYWIIIGAVALLLIGYFTNWFGLKKISKKLKSPDQACKDYHNDVNWKNYNNCVLQYNPHGLTPGPALANCEYLYKKVDWTDHDNCIDNNGYNEKTI